MGTPSSLDVALADGEVDLKKLQPEDRARVMQKIIDVIQPLLQYATRSFEYLNVIALVSTDTPFWDMPFRWDMLYAKLCESNGNYLVLSRQGQAFWLIRHNAVWGDGEDERSEIQYSLELAMEKVGGAPTLDTVSALTRWDKTYFVFSALDSIVKEAKSKRKEIMRRFKKSLKEGGALADRFDNLPFMRRSMI